MPDQNITLMVSRILRALDSNRDNVIDSNDLDFGTLKENLAVDANEDALQQAGAAITIRG